MTYNAMIMYNAAHTSCCNTLIEAARFEVLQLRHQPTACDTQKFVLTMNDTKNTCKHMLRM